MRNLLPAYMLFMMLFLPASCSSGQPGCTDPLALNYDPEATEDDNSCTYQVPSAEPLWTLDLEMQIHETSGLIHWDGSLWTHNDDTDTRLYRLDPGTAEIVGDVRLPGVFNQDWEEIEQDEDYIYVGDFGNNMGNRTNLHILRVEKASMLSGEPAIEKIWFTYSDQEDFISSGLNQTEFDCEAFVVSSDSIYLFTKQWLSGNTTCYALPKQPGNHVAMKKEVFNIQGQVTGASYLEEERLLVLCAYAGLMQPYLYLFRGFQAEDFFSGEGMQVNLLLPFHQVEAVTTLDGIHYYISNERSSASYVNIPQRLHYFDLGRILEENARGD